MLKPFFFELNEDIQDLMFTLAYSTTKQHDYSTTFALTREMMWRNVKEATENGSEEKILILKWTSCF